MAFRIDFSTSKTRLILGAAASVIAICTWLFTRARGEASYAPVTATPLDKKRVSLFANIPGIIDRLYNYLFPQPQPNRTINLGTPDKPLTTPEELKNAIEQHKKAGTTIKDPFIVIYGKELEIGAELAILDLLPTRLILVGAHLTNDFEKQFLQEKWKKCTTLTSVDRAIKAKPSDDDEGVPRRLICVIKPPSRQ